MTEHRRMKALIKELSEEIQQAKQEVIEERTKTQNLATELEVSKALRFLHEHTVT